MKTIFTKLTLLMAVMFLAVTFAGCSKDYDNDIKKLQEQTKDHKDAIDQIVNTELVQIRNQISNLDTQLRNYTDQEVAGALTTIRGELANLEEYLEGEITTLRQTVEENYDILDGKISSLRRQVNFAMFYFGWRLSVIDNSINTLTTDLGLLDGRVVILESYVAFLDELQATILPDLQAADVALGNRITNLARDLRSQVRSLRRSIRDAREDAARDLANALQDLEDGALADIWAQIGINGGDISVLRDDVNTMRNDVNVMSGDVSVLRTDVNVLRADLTSEIARVMGEVSGLEGRILAIEGADFQTQIDDLNTDLSGQLSALDSSVSDLWTALTDPSSGLSPTINDIYSNLSSVWSVFRYMDEVFNGDIGTGGSNPGLLADFATLQSDFDALQTNLATTIADAITGALSPGGSIAAALVALEAGLQGQVDVIDDAINDPTTGILARLGAIEADIAALKADLDKVMARVQSIEYIPDYSDGKATFTGVNNGGLLTLDPVVLAYQVYPAEAAQAIADAYPSTGFDIVVNNVITRAIGNGIVAFNITGIAAAADGVLTVTTQPAVVAGQESTFLALDNAFMVAFKMESANGDVRQTSFVDVNKAAIKDIALSSVTMTYANVLNAPSPGTPLFIVDAEPVPGAWLGVGTPNAIVVPTALPYTGLNNNNLIVLESGVSVATALSVNAADITIQRSVVGHYEAPETLVPSSNIVFDGPNLARLSGTLIASEWVIVKIEVLYKGAVIPGGTWYCCVTR